MSILGLLIPVALVLGFAWLVAFLWSVKSGQYEDMEGAANRILFDEEEEKPDETTPPGKETK